MATSANRIYNFNVSNISDFAAAAASRLTLARLLSLFNGQVGVQKK